MKTSLKWDPFLTVLDREISRFIKVLVQTVITPLVNSVLYLLIFGVSLGAHIKIQDGISYLSFLIPGLVMMGCLNNAFQNASSSIITAKFGGDLEDFRVAPLTRSQIVWAMSLGGLIRGLTVGLMTYLAGLLFVFIAEGQLLGIAHPFILILFLSIGGLTFAKLGISVAFWSKSFDQLSAVTGFILTPLIYLGGVFFTLESLHPWWQLLAKLNPLLYFINGVRYGLIGVSDVSWLMACCISLFTLVVFHLLALRSLRTGSFLRW